MTETRAPDIYDRLKAQVVGFSIRPGDRLNEGALARALGVSRTPLREALNRLLAERLVMFQPGVGFFCRKLEPREIFDLYELRSVIETTAIRSACARGLDEDLNALSEDTLRHGLDITGLTVAEATARDEAFHMGIARMSGNQALTSVLANINDRIRFIRCVNMAARVSESKNEHVAVLSELLGRDADAASQNLEQHIAQRMDQVVSAVKEGISNIYMDGPDALMSRVLEDG